MKLSWVVSASEPELTLAAFLRARLPDLSGKKIKQAIETGLCEVNGIVRTRGSYALSGGERVVYYGGVEEVRKGDVPVLFENEMLVVYDKPSGMNSEDLERGLFLVHRLDRLTSGALIVAKTREAEEQLLDQFKKRRVSKIYWAVVDGVPGQKGGTVENYLGVVRRSGELQWWGEVEPAAGKRAMTDWRLLGTGRGAALIEASPITGRTHQIRLHLKGIGHAILGDTHYCRRFTCPERPQRLMLHAYEISFDDPATGKRLKVTAPVPSAMLELMNRLNIG